MDKPRHLIPWTYNQQGDRHSACGIYILFLQDGTFDWECTTCKNCQRTHYYAKQLDRYEF